MEILQKMAQAVLSGNPEQCISLAEESRNQGIDPVNAIQEGFSAGMETVGVEFESGRMFLPEMMQAAEAMNAGSLSSNPISKKMKRGLKQQAKYSLLQFREICMTSGNYSETSYEYDRFRNPRFWERCQCCSDR